MSKEEKNAARQADERPARRSIQPIPLDELENELRRVRRKGGFFSSMRATLFVLTVLAAVAILVATLWLPVMRIYGNSMSPTLDESDIVVSLKSQSIKPGDLVAFHYENKLLVKRCIAGPKDLINIEEDGTVTVNGQVIDEPYLLEKAKGDCNIELPYQVPDGRYFVMGDNRETSADSRNTVIGCVAQEQIVGKIFFRVWPIETIGPIQ